MNINVSIIDQKVRGLAQKFKPQIEAAIGKKIDETMARSVAFVVLCCCCSRLLMEICTG